jgi:multidrug efflux pump subunit AcrA (membrane-fusion protein)
MGCNAASDAGPDGLTAAVAEGLLTLPESGERVIDYPMVQVALGDILRSSDLSVRLESAVQRDLHFKNDGGRFSEVYVGLWDFVREGDVLAEIVFDNEALLAERGQILLRINQFEEQYINDRMNWLNRLHAAQEYTADPHESEWEIHQLHYMRLEIEYERFEYQQQLRRDELAKQLKDVDERLEGEQLTAPFDGLISYALPGRIDAPVHTWQRIFTITDVSAYFFTLNASKDIVRYGDVFAVSGRSGEIVFDVRVVSDPVSPLLPQNTYTYWLSPVDTSFEQLMAAHGLELTDLRGIGFTATPLNMAVRDVMVLPRRAVLPEDKKSFVYLHEDGIFKKRYVQTGFGFGDEVQIISGLEVGQWVVLMQ